MLLKEFILKSILEITECKEKASIKSPVNINFDIPITVNNYSSYPDEYYITVINGGNEINVSRIKFSIEI